MRAIETMILAGVTFVAAACGPAATKTQAQAQPTAPTQTAATPAPTAPPANAPATAADKAGILRAMQLSANARGLVMNECNDRVEPQYIPADVGLGRTILFVMAGGPNGGYSCYGDGPGL